MRISAFATLDDFAGSDGSFATAANNSGDAPPETSNSVGTDWQTVGIAPYQSAAAALGQVTLSAYDPVGAVGWLTQATQTSQNEIDGWLTQVMQASDVANQSSLAGPGIAGPNPVGGASLPASGPGFNVDYPLITGISGLVVPPVVTPNPMQTHAG